MTRVRALTRQELPCFLELLAVTGFAICQPVLDVFGRSPETFVAEGASSRDVVGFAVIFTLVPALALLALGLFSRLFGARVRLAVHGLTIGVVTGVLVMQLLRAEWSWEGLAVWGLTALASALAAMAVWRLRPFRTFLRFAAVGPLVFALVFLTTSSVSSIVWASPPTLPVAEVPDVPILFVVLDELPTASLLDADGRVDADLVPNLASFAENATWYRNTTTVAPYTEAALPAILTSKRPTEDGVAPIASIHDESLFTWLGRSYEMNVTEPFTDVCPATLCGNNDGFHRGGLRKLLRLGRDVWVDRVRGVEQTTPPAFLLSEDIRVTRVRPYNRFLANFHPDGSRRLDFVHIVLPHGPYRLTPSGAAYEDEADGWESFPNWLDDEAARIGRQRHLLQLQYTDRLVGHVLDRLRRSGHYDRTMIVVTGDHGVSFRGGSAPRAIAKETIPELAWTPLWVKPPGQTEGRIDERPAETVDILPTVADHLGVELPWEADGRSLLGPRPRGDERRILATADTVAEPDEDGYVPLDGRANYRRLLAGGPAVPADGPLRVFDSGRHGALIGRPAGPLTSPDDAPFRGVVEDPVRRAEVDDRTLPLYVRVRVARDEPVPLALVVNGTVANWTRTHRGLETNGWFVIPEELLRPGRNQLSLYLIEEGPVGPVLHAIPSD